MAFTNREVDCIVSKSQIAGWGLNWQHCSHVITFASHSYEQYYQAVRRCWRFGQKNPVHVHIAGSEAERSIQTVISRKSEDHGSMKISMRRAMAAIVNKQQANVSYQPKKAAELPAWL